MATPAQIAEFRSAADELVRLALGDISQVFLSIAGRVAPDQVRDVLLTVTPDVVASYGEVASVLGADWYDLLRAEAVSAPSTTTLGKVPTVEQVQSSTRAVIGPLWDGDVETTWSNLSGAVQRLVMDPLRDSIDASARRDAESGRVAAVSWSRHTRPMMARSGKSCDFCVMLAGRGPVYRSAAAAGAVVGRGSTRSGFDAAGRRMSGGIGGGITQRGEQQLAAKYHDNCHCVAEPTFYEIQEQPRTTRGYTTLAKVLVPIGMGLAA